MNRQDIIDMIAKVYGVAWANEAQLKDLEKFAALVAADEQEAIATEFEKRHEALKHRNNYWLHAANYVRARGKA